jgi:archaellum component FlaG (FlaF/FlaG flagellin family)
MTALRVQRYRYRATRRLQYGCGCALIAALFIVFACAGIYAFSPVWTALAFRFYGVDRIGDTESVFENITPPPVVVVQNASAPSQVTVNLGEYGQETLNANPQTVDVIVGNTQSGAQVATATFTEAGLLELCAQRSEICRGGDSRFRKVSFDLRPGGAVIFAEVNVGGFLWQRVGVVMQLNAVRNGFTVVGVDVNGGLYDYTDLPGEIKDAVDDIQRVGNDLFDEIVVTAGGASYQLIDVSINDTTMTLTMQ